MRLSPVILLSVLIGVSACDEPLQNTPSSDPVNYLALGDSYTIGTSVDSASRWPVQLSDSLLAAGISIDEPYIIARNGWTTDELHAGISEENPDADFDLVSLLIGVNNQYRGYDISIYRTEFEELLEHAIDYAGGDTASVFVLSIPNYGVTPFGESRDPVNIRLELQRYNRVAAGICENFGIPFINITPISELASEQSDLIASDSLHPSAKMYSLWVEEALPVVKEMISSKNSNN